MSPEFIKMQLLTAVIPATICGIIVLLFSRPWNKEIRTSSDVKFYGHSAFGLALGYMFAFWAIIDKIPAFPAEEAYHSLFYMGILVAVVSFANSFTAKWPVRIMGILFLAVVASLFIIPEWVFQDEDEKVKQVIWLWRGGYVGICALLFVSAEKLDEKIHSSLHAFSWFLIATLSSLLMVMAASAKMAQLCGALSAMFMALTVVCLLFSYIPLTRGAMYFASIFLPGIVLNGYLLGSGKMPAISFVLILLAPLFAWAAEIKAARKLSSIWAGVFRLACILLPALIALLIAYQQYSKE